MTATSYQAYAWQAAERVGINPPVFLGLIESESSWNPNALNLESGATGIAQFLQSTARNPGGGIAPFDPTDPFASIDSAADYLSYLSDKKGGLESGILAYKGVKTASKGESILADVMTRAGKYLKQGAMGWAASSAEIPVDKLPKPGQNAPVSTGLSTLDSVLEWMKKAALGLTVGAAGALLIGGGLWVAIQRAKD